MKGDSLVAIRVVFFEPARNVGKVTGAKGRKKMMLGVIGEVGVHPIHPSRNRDTGAAAQRIDLLRDLVEVMIGEDIHHRKGGGREVGCKQKRPESSRRQIGQEIPGNEVSRHQDQVDQDAKPVSPPVVRWRGQKTEIPASRNERGGNRSRDVADELHENQRVSRNRLSMRIEKPGVPLGEAIPFGLQILSIRVAIGGVVAMMRFVVRPFPDGGADEIERPEPMLQGAAKPGFPEKGAMTEIMGQQAQTQKGMTADQDRNRPEEKGDMGGSPDATRSDGDMQKEPGEPERLRSECVVGQGRPQAGKIERIDGGGVGIRLHVFGRLPR